MAFISYGSGNSGIKEYLEQGKKQGREQSRDEIDQRIVLEGDLAICDQIIKSRESEGALYDHIVVSFKEKDMTPEMMKAITSDVKEFLFSAYGDNELYMYAEAHMPKTATEQKWNSVTKQYDTVERYPHIHFVVPRTNLVTGKYSPALEKLDLKFGSKDETMDFTDALQETINKKYELASPKDPENRRTEFVGKSDILSRIKEDEFTGRNREALTMIRDKMIAEKIESPEAFRAMLDKMGVVTVGHGRDGDYLQIKLPDQKQNIRLKDDQFKDAFLSKTMQEKFDYYNKKSAGQTPEQQAAETAKRELMMEKWKDIRSREIKYVRNRTGKFYKEHYVKATDEEKILMLDRLEVEHYAKLEKKYGYVNDKPNEAAIERLRQAEGLDQAQRDAVERYANTAHIEKFTSEKLNATYLRTNDELREAKEAGKEIIKEPESAIASLTFSQSHFNEAALERHLLRNTADQDQYNEAMKAVLACPDLVINLDGERLLFTSKTIVAIEKNLADRSERMAVHQVGAVSAAEQQRVIDARPFNDGQRAGFELLCSDRQLAVVNGAAGTGKSFVLAAMREAYENEGHKVYGAILQGKTAEDLERDSGIQSRTIAKMLNDLDKGKLKLDGKSVLVVDEAGMVGSRDLEKLMAHTEAAGARLRLVGDSKQLAAVEYGNAFAEVSTRAEVASLTQIMRQKTEWMREASEKFATHDIAGLTDYAERGHVHIEDTTKDAQIALVKSWSAHQAAQPEQTQIVLAHTNAARIELNDMMRAELKARGQLQNEITVTTKRGPLPMATGEQVMFTRSDKDLGVKNGTTGTIAKISAEGVITVALENGKTAQFNARQDPEKGTEIDYGWACTVHRSQGMTVDRALVLADPSMTKENLGVAMTRHRHSAELFGSAEQFPTVKDMAQTLDRAGQKAFTAGKEWDSAQRPEDSVIGQHVADMNAERVIERAAKTASYQEIAGNLEAKRVLDYVSKSHGIDIEQYRVVTNEAGKELIQSENGKTVDAAAFLTKTMHLDYKTEAAPILKQCYAEQLENAYSQPRREPGQGIDQTMQAEFTAYEKARTAQLKIDKEALDEAKRTSTAAIEKSTEKEADKARAVAALSASTKAEKDALDAAHVKTQAVAYKDFLAEKAPDSERHRAELARVTLTSADRERLALVTVQAQGIPCLTPDFSKLTAAQIEKGVSHVLNSSPDHGRPPAHIIARNAAAARARSADDLVRDPERAPALEAEGSRGVHELPNGRVDGNGQVDRGVLPDAVHGRVGDEQARQNQDVRRTGASTPGSERSAVTPPAVQAVAVEPAHQATPAPAVDLATPLTPSKDFNQQAQRAAAPAAEKEAGGLELSLERKEKAEAAPEAAAGITDAEAAENVAKGIAEAQARMDKAIELAKLSEAHRKEQEEKKAEAKATEAKAAEAAKAEEAAKAKEAERLGEPAQLADIEKRIDAARAEAHHHSPMRDKPAKLADEADHQKVAIGKIVAANETLVAVDTGREITVFKAQELDKNLKYDGIATGPDRYAKGNEIELKHTPQGDTRAILREEREEKQTEQRKEIERSKDNGMQL